MGRMDPDTYKRYLVDIDAAPALMEGMAEVFRAGLLEEFASQPEGAQHINDLLGNMATRNMALVSAINYGEPYTSVSSLFYLETGEHEVLPILVEAARRNLYVSGEKMDWDAFEEAVKAGISPEEWEKAKATYPEREPRAKAEPIKPNADESVTAWMARVQAAKKAQATAKAESDEPQFRLRGIVFRSKPSSQPRPAATGNIASLLAKLKGGTTSPAATTVPAVTASAPSGISAILARAKAATATPVVQLTTAVDPLAALKARLGKTVTPIVDEKVGLIAHFRSLNGNGNAGLIADGLEGKSGAAPLSVEEAKQFASTLNVPLP